MMDLGGIGDIGDARDLWFLNLVSPFSADLSTRNLYKKPKALLRGARPGGRCPPDPLPWGVAAPQTSLHLRGQATAGRGRAATGAELGIV